MTITPWLYLAHISYHPLLNIDIYLNFYTNTYMYDCTLINIYGFFSIHIHRHTHEKQTEKIRFITKYEERRKCVCVCVYTHSQVFQLNFDLKLSLNNLQFLWLIFRIKLSALSVTDSLKSIFNHSSWKPQKKNKWSWNLLLSLFGFQYF